MTLRCLDQVSRSKRLSSWSISLSPYLLISSSLLLFFSSSLPLFFSSSLAHRLSAMLCSVAAQGLPHTTHPARVEALRFLSEALFEDAMARLDEAASSESDDGEDEEGEAEQQEQEQEQEQAAAAAAEKKAAAAAATEKKAAATAAAVERLERSIKALGEAVEVGKLCRGEDWEPVRRIPDAPPMHWLRCRITAAASAAAAAAQATAAAALPLLLLLASLSNYMHGSWLRCGTGSRRG